AEGGGMKRTLCLCGTSLALLAIVGAGLIGEQRVAAQARSGAPARGAAPAQGATATAAAPRYQNNPLWPQPLPNHWVFGAVSGVAVDAQDHVWAVHRGAATLEGNEK